MSKLESFKKKKFAKELTNEQMKSLKGAQIAAMDTGTRCNPTNSQCMDCDDSDSVD
ncbi:hypothetical protein [Flavobacterium humidisoli]|jgi:hypothetical protein|uniref:Natural product n=1 Tax=Flavobacterium humidisoli TaxID=2937442 RepID=A0ABY4LY40_9FLAO|nr:hypothetical protein [Flavobacterium humidisoli]UPZ17993.1 hypothetical protein M0M44_11740 [Flavobacterium humidisoli]